MTLSGLFREGADYASALSAEVKRQMEEKPEEFFVDEFTAIDPEQNFYFNEDGALVLVFDEYTVAPGSSGMPEFTIPSSVTDGLLK